MLGLHRKAIWLAVAIGFDSGPRIGNTTQADGLFAEDHCTKDQECTFMVKMTCGTTIVLEGGPPIAVYLRVNVGRTMMVLSVSMQYVTYKTHESSRKPRKFWEGEAFMRVSCLMIYACGC